MRFSVVLPLPARPAPNSFRCRAERFPGHQRSCHSLITLVSIHWPTALGRAFSGGESISVTQSLPGDPMLVLALEVQPTHSQAWRPRLRGAGSAHPKLTILGRDGEKASRSHIDYLVAEFRDWDPGLAASSLQPSVLAVVWCPATWGARSHSRFSFGALGWSFGSCTFPRV